MRSLSTFSWRSRTFEGQFEKGSEGARYVVEGAKYRFRFLWAKLQLDIVV
jgi:hypothetical protein